LVIGNAGATLSTNVPLAPEPIWEVGGPPAGADRIGLSGARIDQS
jgi:hypothetical protein